MEVADLLFAEKMIGFQEPIVDFHDCVKDCTF